MTNDSALQIPNVLLGDLLGEGSFGAVYKGRHEILDIDVAVKIIKPPDSPADYADIERTLREAQFMARLDHPNLLRIFDAGRNQETIYLVLEFMDGGSCAGMRNLPAEQGMTIARQLLSGLQAMHDARVLHRDIKPANCLIRLSDGRLKLADLGIATEMMTHTGKVYDTAGTIPYMAPELFANPPKYGYSSDLYALGMTLACLLLGANPFPSAPMPELIHWIRHGERPRLTVLRPDLPTELALLIERLISPAIEDRPRDAAEALRLLNAQAPIQSRANPSPADAQSETIGPWTLGDRIYASSNWHGYIVTHVETGIAARLMHLQPTGPLKDQTDSIIASAERASRINHPGIVRVLDWGGKAGRAFVVTAQQGRALDDLIRSAGPRSEIEVLGFAGALSAALAYLHANDLVYQVFDPGAAVITPDARSAQLSWPVFCVPAGTLAVTPDGKAARFMVPIFAAPEAIHYIAPTIEPAVDIYGLGIVLYYLLVGDNVFTTNPKPETLAQLRAAAPRVTAPTGRLILDMMKREPEQRPSATIAGEEIRQILRRLAGDADSHR